MRNSLVELVLGLIAIPLVVFLHFHFGLFPVAVADPALPMEKRTIELPLDARVDREYPRKPGLDATAANLQFGAQIDRQQGAVWDGLYGLPSAYGDPIHPHGPQLWAPHGDGVVGVSDDPPADWKAKDGVGLTGMPSFEHLLNETQIWPATQLWATADRPMPPAVLDSMKQPLDLDPAGTR